MQMMWARRKAAQTVMAAFALALWPAAGAAQSADGRAPAGFALGVTAGRAETALRDALVLASRRGMARVGQRDGFWADGAIRIPLPDRLEDLRRTLAPLGLATALDDLHLRLNRAAEAAASRAASHFVSAVQALTVSDALTILRGPETAATDYFRAQTERSLAQAIRPPVAQALEQAGALRALERLSRRYAELGSQSRAALTDFAVRETLDGLFYAVAREERAIRTDPAARATALLRQVFGPP